MHKVKRVKSERIFPVIKEIIANGTSARITVTGMSMYPFLRENVDSVELSNTNMQDIHRGDIVMVLRKSNEYVMHRVQRIEKNCFYMVGDAQQSIEGPLEYNQLIAKVTAIWRMDRRVECSNLLWKLLSGLWLILLPFRAVIIKNYQRLRS